MLTQYSKVYKLFAEIGDIPSPSLNKSMLYDMFRTVLEVISGKAEINMLYSTQKIWIPYLQKYYTNKQVNDFNEVLSQVKFEGFTAPLLDNDSASSATSSTASPTASSTASPAASPTSKSLALAWAVGFLSAEILYRPT